MRGVAVAALALLGCACNARVVSVTRGGANDTALAAAVEAGDATSVRALLAGGVDLTAVIATPDRGERTPWELALMKLPSATTERTPPVDIVVAMLEAGADPNASWSHLTGGTQHTTSVPRVYAAELAASAANADVVPAMLARGLRTKGPGARAALLVAVDLGNMGTVGLLLGAGVDPNVGYTDEMPLAHAISRGDPAMIRLLESKGAREFPAR